MTEIDTSRIAVERAARDVVNFSALNIRSRASDTLRALLDRAEKAEAERDRYGTITATIRVNAMKRGATDEQIAAFLSGEECFIQWMIEHVKSVDSPTLLARAEKAEAERDEAWNAAIEAAATVATCDGCDATSELIRALKEGPTND